MPDTPLLTYQPINLELRNPFRLSYGVSDTRRARDTAAAWLKQGPEHPPGAPRGIKTSGAPLGRPGHDQEDDPLVGGVGFLDGVYV